MPFNFLLSVGSLCYSSYLLPSLPLSWEPWMLQLWHLAEAGWGGEAEAWLGESEAWFGSSHSPCHAGYEELGQMKTYQTWGGQRWSRLGSRRCHMWLELRLWEGSVPTVTVSIWNCESAAVPCPAPATLSCAVLRLCEEWEVMAFFIRMQCVFLQADLWICKTCTK